MVVIYHQLQRWAPPAPPIKGFCSIRGNLPIAQLDGLSGPWTSSAHENCNQRIQSCQGRNLPVFFFFFFLPRWWRQKPNWHGGDMSVHPRQTCIRLTCHYLPSFPVWPAIIPSQLRLPRDEHGAGSTEPGTRSGLICSSPLHKRKQLCHRDRADCIRRGAPSDGMLIPQSESTSFGMWLIDPIIRHYEKCKLRKWLNSASF